MIVPGAARRRDQSPGGKVALTALLHLEAGTSSLGAESLIRGRHTSDRHYSKTRNWAEGPEGTGKEAQGFLYPDLLASRGHRIREGFRTLVKDFAGISGGARASAPITKVVATRRHPAREEWPRRCEDVGEGSGRVRTSTNEPEARGPLRHRTETLHPAFIQEGSRGPSCRRAGHHNATAARSSLFAVAKASRGPVKPHSTSLHSPSSLLDACKHGASASRFRGNTSISTLGEARGLLCRRTETFNAAFDLECSRGFSHVVVAPAIAVQQWRAAPSSQSRRSREGSPPPT
ncbi:hypothetical protein BKA93DRAFT_753830, partial [Sparassis latifolia]